MSSMKLGGGVLPSVSTRVQFASSVRIMKMSNTSSMEKSFLTSYKGSCFVCILPYTNIVIEP